ncbi:MAG: winged helix-turn-helix transcriptional regulator [Deltaproteobacteria bacterium]|nr:winged helix-turn-helix transcriptional regulator [Deltaproteobacteria bacterium]
MSPDGVGERLSAKQQEILNLIQLDPRISTKRIVSEIGVSTRKTEDHLRKLQIGGFLRRVGPRRGGHWEVQPCACLSWVQRTFEERSFNEVTGVEPAFLRITSRLFSNGFLRIDPLFL